ELLRDPGETVLNLARVKSAWYRQTEGRSALARLIDEFPSELRQIFEWSVQNQVSAPAEGARRAVATQDFLFQVLGAVGEERTVVLLLVHTLDPDGGREAVAAIRAINDRLLP